MGIKNDIIIDNALQNVKNGDYLQAESVLIEYLNKISKNRSDVRRILYSELIRELEEAQGFRDSPDFVDKQNIANVNCEFLTAPMALFP